jgi:putative oxidoreductase
MKRLFNTNFNNESVHAMLLVLRVAMGSLMLVHGYQKLGWLTAGGEIQFGDPIGIGAHASLVLAVLAEFLCAMLLILGLATRLALIPLITTMLVAVFIVHGPDGLDKKEIGLLFLSSFLFLLVSGPGKYSVDTVISRSLNSRRR